jgi:anaerobic ribonucleoside-triphosphate reductase activating protein
VKYAGLIKNDIVNGEGVCVSFWTQGCPFKCKGCHNPQTWDFDGGKDLPNDIKGQIVKAISDNNITRNFSILGGEPLCEQNIELVKEILLAVKTAYPHIKVFLWTGYELEDIKDALILEKVDVLITGPYIEEQRDITLPLRGSYNQKVLRKEIDF